MRESKGKKIDKSRVSSISVDFAAHFFFLFSTTIPIVTERYQCNNFYDFTASIRLLKMLTLLSMMSYSRHGIRYIFKWKKGTVYDDIVEPFKFYNLKKKLCIFSTLAKQDNVAVLY